MSKEFPEVKFGAFFGPYHHPDRNTTLQLQQDLQLIEHLDRLGFAEAWVGEHHTGGAEIIASPEIFLAAAAERTQRIKLGLGVVSAPYHHPFLIADRAVLLDHLTQGRVMLGIGPGQLIDDSKTLGLDVMENRRKMEQAFSVIHRLLQGETVSEETDWFKVDGYIQMKPYSNIQMAATGAWSPNGPSLAGRYGASLLSLGATTKQGVELLADHWRVVEENAAANGHVANRADWHLLQVTHIAETEEQARKDLEYGYLELNNYMAQISPASQTYPDLPSVIQATNDSGGGVIGTPEMLVERIRELQEESGGFGHYLMLQGDWASHEATKRSYQLIAEEVMPHLNGSAAWRRRGWDDVMNSGEAGSDITAQAVAATRAEFERRKKEAN